jgi:hypothetical protein
MGSGVRVGKWGDGGLYLSSTEIDTYIRTEVLLDKGYVFLICYERIVYRNMVFLDELSA